MAALVVENICHAITDRTADADMVRAGSFCPPPLECPLRHLPARSQIAFTQMNWFSLVLRVVAALSGHGILPAVAVDLQTRLAAHRHDFAFHGVTFRFNGVTGIIGH